MTFKKGMCTLTYRRQNGEVCGYIRKRNADGLFAARLRVPQTGNRINLMNKSEETEEDDDLKPTLSRKDADALQHKRLPHENPSIVRAII